MSLPFLDFTDQSKDRTVVWCGGRGRQYPKALMRTDHDRCSLALGCLVLSYVQRACLVPRRRYGTLSLCWYAYRRLLVKGARAPRPQ